MVVPDPEALDKLVMAIIAATKIVYVSDVEEMSALKSMLELELTEAVDAAFKVGKKMGKMSSDSADTSMYMPIDTPIILTPNAPEIML